MKFALLLKIILINKNNSEIYTEKIKPRIFIEYLSLFTVRVAMTRFQKIKTELDNRLFGGIYTVGVGENVPL